MAFRKEIEKRNLITVNAEMSDFKIRALVMHYVKKPLKLLMCVNRRHL
jgi:hypothetical protein